MGEPASFGGIGGGRDGADAERVQGGSVADHAGVALTLVGRWNSEGKK